MGPPSLDVARCLGGDYVSSGAWGPQRGTHIYVPRHLTESHMSLCFAKCLVGPICTGQAPQCSLLGEVSQAPALSACFDFKIG